MAVHSARVPLSKTRNRGECSGLDTVLSIVVLAAMALLAGAWFLWRRGGSKRQVFMMILLALIMVANVAIWTVPDASGEAPLAQVRD